MKKLNWTFIIVALIIGGLFFAYADQKPKEEIPIQEESTEIVHYEQTSIPTKTRTGGCWSTSTGAQSNPNALRCSVGNIIHDPCFITEDNQVVCDVNPETGEGGFLLELKDSIIPEEEIEFTEKKELSPDKIHPWIAELENGLRCQLIQGTALEIDGELYNYFCGDEKTVLAGNFGETFDKSKQLWKTKVVYLSEDYEKSMKSETVSVRKVWY